MANPERHEFELVLGGATYTFKLGTSALIALQERLKREEFGVGRVREALDKQKRLNLSLRLGPTSGPLSDVRVVCLAPLEAALDSNKIPSIDEILRGVHEGRVLFTRALLWAGLRAYHAELTEEDVSDVIDRASEPEMRALLKQLGMSITPDPQDLEALGVTNNGTEKKTTPPKRPTRGTGARSISKRAASA